MRKRKVVGTILGIALVFMMIEGLACVAVPRVFPLADDVVVTFPDPNLEAAIREAIGKPTGDIYQSDLEPLTTLYASGRQIADLTGMEYCTSLEHLRMNVNQISDISPLSQLISLQWLELIANPISDISPLSGLCNLRELDLYCNQISDISAVANLTNLQVLFLNENQVSDISPLSGLTGLTRLSLFDNRVSDISPISNLTSLTGLYLSQNPISDISPLSSLTNLDWLGLDACGLGDISPLSGLTSLTQLFLYTNHISDISPLSGLTNLIVLELWNNQISDVSPLAGLTNLTTLRLYINQISDVSPLADLTNLTQLNLAGNQISDVLPLANLTNLTYLHLHSNQISDIEPLVNNPGLAQGDEVHLTNNPLSDTSMNTYVPQLEARGVTVYYDAPSNQAPNKPTNASPVNGATGVSPTPTLTSSSFSDPDVSDTHAASQWQITTTSGDYSSPVYDSGTDPANLESIPIPSGTLSESMTYYWHVRHQDNHGAWSIYSDETSFTTEEIVVFPDPNLEAAIREAIGKPTGDIYQSDLVGLTTLDADSRGIADLTGLEYCTSLADLRLGNNEISNISSLSALTNLTYLYLVNNQISDVSPLSGLTGLTDLFLANMQINDISPLSGLTSLTQLHLYGGGQISDISPLSGLTSLTALKIDTNQISDISPLSSLTSLTSLTAEGNQISDISPLSGLTSLTYLALSQNQISDINALSSLNSLTMLYIGNNQIEEVSPLSGLTNLDYIRIRYNQITDISPLSSLTNLSNLDLGWNQISAVPPLSGLTNLRELYIHGNQISDISGLSGLNSLTELVLFQNQIVDITPLSGLTSLIRLWLNDNLISDIDALSGLTNLTNWHGMTALRLESNQISDIAALVANPGLSTGDTVNLENNPLSATSVNTYIPQLEARGVTVLYTAPQPPDQPSNVSPAHGATGVGLTPTLQSSAFSDPDVGDTHAASQWQITTTLGDYSSPVFDSGNDTSNLISVAIPSGILNANITYYWHVRHQDNRGDWSSYSGETSFTTEEIIVFPDPNLEAAIREAIGKPTGDIYQSDLDGLTMLYARGRNIINLIRLEHCTSLTELDLSDNQISDISPLGNLTSLTSLALYSNQISDISPLASLANLERLGLSYNSELSDILPLANLANLSRLSLSWNQISDVAPLANLTGLTFLDLSLNHQISDISPLVNLTNLTYLKLSWNQISDIAPVSGLTNLTQLGLSNNQISDIASVFGLTSLIALELDQNQISDIAPVSGLTNLTQLSLDGNQISDIEPLVNNPGLSTGDTIDLRSNPLNTKSVNVYIPELEGRGVTVSWDTANQLPNQPSNVSPVDTATGISLTPTLESATFSDPDVGDTHAASQWQITKTPGDYSSPAYDGGTDPANLESIAIPSGTLSESTTYYWHIRHQDNRGDWSSWSAETSFTTEGQYTLTVNILGNGSVSKNPDQATYTYGQNVQLTATAAPGWSFSGWSGDLTGSTNPGTVTMNSDKMITAAFSTLLDATPPAAVTDLAISTATDNCITLTWTASGDDGYVNSASQYDIRYSPSHIIEANWDSAAQCAGEPSPQPASSSESFVVTGLSPETTYYFALKTADEVPNWSGLSNVASGTTSSRAGGSVSGVVRESDGITSIGGAKIFAYDSNQGILVSSAESDDDGTYIIVGLPAGSYEVKATSSGYVDEWYQEETSSDKADHVHVTAGKDTPDIDFSLSRIYDAPIGGNVTVVDPYNGVTMVFAQVSEAGVISISPSEKNPGGNITGFKFLGKYYDIKTTADYTGPVTVTIAYDDDDVTGKEEKLKLFHLVDGVWEPIPPENQSIDTVNNTITVVVDTLSWFAIAEPVSEGGCFIATAAYGTPMAEEIQILREFRDEYLLTNPLGQALVDLYYKVSPPIAEFIAEHPGLKLVVRVGLVPAVAMSAVVINTTPVEKIAVVGLLVLVSVAVAIWARKRRDRGPEYI